jgi:hypothetical protein
MVRHGAPQRGQYRVARKQTKLVMKFDIGPIQCNPIAGQHTIPHPIKNAVEPRQQCRIAAQCLRRRSHNQAFQRYPRFNDLCLLAVAELDDPRPSIRRGRDDPLCLQDADRLANRNPARAESRSKLGLH